MAKINLNQHNQEYPSSVILTVLGSLGVLLCMVVTVLNIKLWWFKHRLSFEQTSTQNGAAGGSTPQVVVPRRIKKSKFNKDKRYSEQIYSSVDVHGVFRQRQEDELDIERPQQLPPVRIRQLSESTQSLILPPPRNKRRQLQVNSTAFEDLDTGTPIITPTISTTGLAATDGTRLSLTFEEFEKQFKLKEIKPEIKSEIPTEIITDNQEAKLNKEVREIPVPPLRLNRSSSAMVNTDSKTPRYLKSSQSITIPEFHKVIERRPTGFSRPTEDLTKIDDYEETVRFENFGERRPTGYIKYEEVDGDLSHDERYEKELNHEEEEEEDRDIFDNWEQSKEAKALQDLRNDTSMYQNEGPEEGLFARVIKEENYKKREFKEPAYTKSFQTSEISTEYEDFSNNPQQGTTNYIQTEDCYEEFDYKSIKDRRSTEFVRELVNEQYEEFPYKSVEEQKRPNEFVKDLEADDDFDNQFTNWPQFEEKIETPKVNIRKFDNHDFQTQFSVEEAQVKTYELPESEYTVHNTPDKSKQRRKWEEETYESEIENFEGSSSSKQKKLYSQVRSLMTDDVSENRHRPEVTFELSELENSETEEYNDIKQRRPTGFVRTKVNENFSEGEFSDIELSKTEEPEASGIKQRRPTGFVREYIEAEFEDDAETDDSKNSALKQRRPTGFVREDIEAEYEDDAETDDSKNSALKQRRPTGFVREDIEAAFGADPETGDSGNSALKQRRPTGFVREDIEAAFGADAETDDSGNSALKQRRPTGFVREDIEAAFGADAETYDIENSALKQRRPTGFVRNDQEPAETEKSVTLKVNNEKDIEKYNKYSKAEDPEASALQQRRPTGFVREDIEATFGTDAKAGDSERRPTGFIRIKDTDIGDSSNELQLPTVKFESPSWEDNETYSLNQRRPTGYIRNINPDTEEAGDEPQPQVVKFESTSWEENENYSLNQRRPTGFIRNTKASEYSDEEQDIQINELPPETKVKFAENITDSQNESESWLGKQRRPTGFIKKSEITEILDKDSEELKDQEIIINELSSETKVKFAENITDSQNESESWLGKQRRPTGFIKKSEIKELLDKDFEEVKVTFAESTDFNESSSLKQRRPTGFPKNPYADQEETLELSNDIIKLENPTVRFKEKEELQRELEYYTDSLIKQRRPTGFPKDPYTETTELSNDITKLENPTVRFKEMEESDRDLGTQNDSLIKHRRPTGFIKKTDIEDLQETVKQVNFNLDDFTQEEVKYNPENEALKTRRPTGFIKSTERENVKELTGNLPDSPSIHLKSKELSTNESAVDPIWQELEKDLDTEFFSQNIEEEFAKIRHSYELNEADFLEVKKELRKSKPLGFGKSIEDDWDNFEKLKTPPRKLDQEQIIQITYNEQQVEELQTTSILKESKQSTEISITSTAEKVQEELQPKPRKSKVTFDFKTEEHLIPARSNDLDSEEEDYYEDYSDYDDEEVYNRPPPPIPPPPLPPQPMLRLSTINYNTEEDPTTSSYSAVIATPTSISLFGSQVSPDAENAEDSWSAIRKHRNLTSEFQSLALPSSPPPVLNSTPPPRPAYRNPLAQLAIQRAKEVRLDMDGFKSRSIKDVRKPEASKRNTQNMLHLNNDEFNDTEA